MPTSAPGEPAGTIPPGRASPRLRLLGPIGVIVEDGVLEAGTPRQRVVLAVLALNANRVTPVDRLVDALWDGDPPETARGQIQVCIWGLRKLLSRAGAPNTIKTCSPGYLLESPPDQLDTELFGALVAAAREQADAGRVADAASTLRDALRLWRGPALAGVRSDLLQRGAAQLEEARLTALEKRITYDLMLGLHQQVVGELHALCAEHPAHEAFHGLLMLALYRCGRQADALAVGRRVRRFLIDEVGIEPGMELRVMERSILAQDPVLDRPTDEARPSAAVEPAASLGGEAPRPAGSVALARVSVSVAERPYQAPYQVPHLLPASIADFTGRQAQTSRIARLLAEEQHPYAVRIVAIHGKAGAGKSSLAVRVAHELGKAFPDGHLYADMGSGEGDDPASGVLARFLRALGVDGSSVPEDPTEQAEMYRSRVADRRVLVVLDDVAAEDQVLPVLPGSPTCAVIVTGRRRLGALSGWHPVDVGVLDLDESIELLGRIVGAQRVRAEREEAAELADLCGGLPLALRIAGARLASRPDLRISALVRCLSDDSRRLDELTHHGLALRTTIDAAYRRLSEPAQRLLRLCTLMPGPDFPGWTAAALLGTRQREAADLLETLVDAQLLDPVEYLDTPLPHYRVHDLTSLHAREQLLLAESEQDRRIALGRVLGAWLARVEQWQREARADIARRHSPSPRADTAGPATIRRAHERRSLLAVIALAHDTGFDELCRDLALIAADLFECGGYLDEWRQATRLALAATGQHADLRATAAILRSADRLDAIRHRDREGGRVFPRELPSRVTRCHRPRSGGHHPPEECAGSATRR